VRSSSRPAEKILGRLCDDYSNYYGAAVGHLNAKLARNAKAREARKRILGELRGQPTAPRHRIMELFPAGDLRGTSSQDSYVS
jgi:hypothetical protein